MTHEWTPYVVFALIGVMAFSLAMSAEGWKALGFGYDIRYRWALMHLGIVATLVALFGFFVDVLPGGRLVFVIFFALVALGAWVARQER